MRVLVIGATGFIGARVAAHLRAAGHDVIGASRRRQEAFHAHPEYGWIVADFNRDFDWHVWRPRLHAIDAVVNCAGLHEETRDETFEAVHALGPAALYEACVRYGVKRVVHLTVPGHPGEKRSHHLASRRFAETRLEALDLDWMVLVHPPLVIAQTGGGRRAGVSASALQRCANATTERCAPMALDDLCLAVLRALDTADARRRVDMSALASDHAGDHASEREGARSNAARVSPGAAAFRALTGRPPRKVQSAGLVLLYDGGCPVCAMEMRQLRRRDTRRQLGFVDITALDFNPARYGASLADLMGRMHAVRADGALLVGMDAIRAIYAAIGLGWLLAPTRLPFIKPLADWGYLQFARHRMRISRWLGLGRIETERCGAACRIH